MTHCVPNHVCQAGISHLRVTPGVERSRIKPLEQSHFIQRHAPTKIGDPESKRHCPRRRNGGELVDRVVSELGRPPDVDDDPGVRQLHVALGRVAECRQD
eukprot:1737962-Pyramimonas_sp.AAC.1